jgi:hypothetical protein
MEAAVARASAMNKLSEMMKGEIRELGKQLCHAREEAEVLRSAALVRMMCSCNDGVALCSRARDRIPAFMLAMTSNNNATTAKYRFSPKC